MRPESWACGCCRDCFMCCCAHEDGFDQCRIGFTPCAYHAIVKQLEEVRLNWKGKAR